MLRDRLVCGINEDHIKKTLLSEKTLTLEKGLELALSMESAAANSIDIQKSCNNSVVGNIKSLKSSKGRPSKSHERRGTFNGNKCYRCDSRRHDPNDS